MSDILNLRQYSYRLYLNLIKAHVKERTLLPTELEQDCVKAFCVLSHAALEEYFETLSKMTLQKAYKRFKSGKFVVSAINSPEDFDSANKLINQIIKTLVLSSCYSIYSTNQSEVFKIHKSKIEEVGKSFDAGNTLNLKDLENLTRQTNSYTKDIFKNTIAYFDDHISNNHGASLKYILKLLIPVGIDIPQDVALNSLQNLSKYRGEYAHTKGSVTQLKSASDVAIYLIDIIKMCQRIENGITAM